MLKTIIKNKNEQELTTAPWNMTSQDLPEALEESSNSNIETTQHIGFKLHNKEFLMPMLEVKEIIMLPEITYVPYVDPMIEGIVALRGEIMPVLNLRRMMGFPSGKATFSTRIIHIECERGGFGVIVDEITEFVGLSAFDIESIDQNFFDMPYPFLSGVSKKEDLMRGILDVSKLINKVVSYNLSFTENDDA